MNLPALTRMARISQELEHLLTNTTNPVPCQIMHNQGTGMMDVIIDYPAITGEPNLNLDTHPVITSIELADPNGTLPPDGQLATAIFPDDDTQLDLFPSVVVHQDFLTPTPHTVTELHEAGVPEQMIAPGQSWDSGFWMPHPYEPADTDHAMLITRHTFWTTDEAVDPWLWLVRTGITIATQAAQKAHLNLAHFIAHQQTMRAASHLFHAGTGNPEWAFVQYPNQEDQVVLAYAPDGAEEPLDVLTLRISTPS